MARIPQGINSHKLLQILTNRFNLHRSFSGNSLVKCSSSGGLSSVEIMDSRGLLSNVNFSIGLVWSMLGFGGEDTKSNKETSVSSYIEQAEAAIQENKLKEAQYLLEEALQVTKEIQAVGVYCVYDMLATLAFRQGDVERAEKILLQVIQRLAEKNIPSSHNTVVNFHLKLARIHSTMGKDFLAENGFRKCLNIQQTKFLNGERDEETLLLCLNVQFWYGKFLVAQKKYSDAKQCFENAFTLSADLKSIDSRQALVILYHLGEVAFVAGEMDEALKHLTNGVILGRAINSKDMPTYYMKIALVYHQKGMYNEARNWAKKAKKCSVSRQHKAAKLEAESLLRKIGKASTSIPR